MCSKIVTSARKCIMNFVFCATPYRCPHIATMSRSQSRLCGCHQYHHHCYKQTSKHQSNLQCRYFLRELRILLKQAQILKHKSYTWNCHICINLRITILCPESSQAIPLSVLPDLKHLVISLLLIRCFHRIFLISSFRSYPDRPNILSPLGQSRPTVLQCKNVTSPTGRST